MDRNSGRVSPQYHVKYNIAFDTVQSHPLQCSWMNKAGFIRSIINTPTKDPQQKETHTHTQGEQTLTDG